MKSPKSGRIHEIDCTTKISLALQRAGFQMALDDVGTGYSSLAYLRHFANSELKTDRMFMAGIAGSRPGYQIVHSIIDLAHNFGPNVVAESMQTVNESTGMRPGTGYVYAKPMAARSLLPWSKVFWEDAG